MDFEKVLRSRHSIREYKQTDVSYKDLGVILDAAITAPSSGNMQNWRFIIVKDKKKKEEIARSCLDQLWMNQAPVHIVVCYDEENIKKLFPEDYYEFSIQNTAIISTYIILKATELNLGSCWVAISNKRRIERILELPENYKPVNVITLGYPINGYRKTTREQVKFLIHFESYRKRERDTSLVPLSKNIEKIKEKVKTRLKRK